MRRVNSPYFSDVITTGLHYMMDSGAVLQKKQDETKLFFFPLKD